MKKFTLLFFMLLAAGFAGAQSVAKNFNCNDCNSNNHDLFTELDAGKVIVLCWVMPCSLCSGPASSANSIVNSFATSNPGKVKFYLVDDVANTSCSSLNSWGASTGLTNYTSFSNSSIKMTDYGITGMPKIVVLSGGSSHLVYFNQSDSLNTVTFNAAIKNAISWS